jgi:hypothetical protein
MLKRTTFAAALCALALPAAAPAAEPRVDYYNVVGAGQGTYKLDIDLSSESAVETSLVEASFRWRAVIPTVKFVDGRFAGVMQTTLEQPELSGELKRAIRLISKRPGVPPLVVDCEGADVSDDDRVNMVNGEAPNALVFEPFDSVDFVDHKCSNGNQDRFGIFDDEGDPHALQEEFGVHDVFDQHFELPPEAVGAGRIVQWVKPRTDQVLGPNCPTYSQAPGQRCTVRLDWAGSITFTKVDPGELIAPLIPDQQLPTSIDRPLPAPAPAPAPAPPVRPAGPKPPTGTVARDGRTATVKVPCTAACTGTVTVRAGGRTFVRPFQGTAGRTTRVTARVPASVRRGSTIRVTIKVRSGGRTTTRTLRLRRP